MILLDATPQNLPYVYTTESLVQCEQNNIWKRLTSSKGWTVRENKIFDQRLNPNLISGVHSIDASNSLITADEDVAKIKDLFLKEIDETNKIYPNLINDLNASLKRSVSVFGSDNIKLTISYYDDPVLVIRIKPRGDNFVEKFIELENILINEGCLDNPGLALSAAF